MTDSQNPQLLSLKEILIASIEEMSPNAKLPNEALSTNVLDPGTLMLGSDDLENQEEDAMNELDLPDPGSFKHYERLFYPKVPCNSCSTCLIKLKTKRR